LPNKIKNPVEKFCRYFYLRKMCFGEPSINYNDKSQKKKNSRNREISLPLGWASFASFAGPSSPQLVSSPGMHLSPEPTADS